MPSRANKSGPRFSSSATLLSKLQPQDNKAGARSQGVFFVNLNEIIARQYEALGQEKVSKEFFFNDHTHTSPAGARLNAEAVVAGLRELKKCPLAKFLLKKAR